MKTSKIIASKHVSSAALGLGLLIMLVALAVGGILVPTTATAKSWRVVGMYSAPQGCVAMGQMYAAKGIQYSCWLNNGSYFLKVYV